MLVNFYNVLTYMDSECGKNNTSFYAQKFEIDNRY